MKTVQAIVAENIKERMRELGLTQKTLAERLKTSQPTVSAWVNSETLPDKKSQEKLCKALECKIERLVKVPQEDQFTNTLKMMAERLSSIETILKAKEAQPSPLKDLGERLKKRAAELGKTPFEVLMQEIAEEESTALTSPAQSSPNQKRTL